MMKAVAYALFILFCFPSCASVNPEGGLTVRERQLLTTLPHTHSDAVEYGYEKMIAAGISPSFAIAVKNRFLSTKHDENLQMRDRIVSLNVLGFLSHGNYAAHYSPFALRKTRAFIKKYAGTLRAAEKHYGVQKEVIAALLWVETKHGTTTGSFSLPFVYFSLLQSEHPDVAVKSLADLNSRKPAATAMYPELSNESLEQKVIDRSIKKSSWALEQLKTMDHLYHHRLGQIIDFKGSYAGAFGYPQFIPSTYENFAVSAYGKKKRADLFNMRDAIVSVANFLNAKGWKKADPAARSNALFEYNHSRDYGDVIEKIAADLYRS